MNGSIVERGKNRYALVLDLGYVVNAEGKRTRRQKWINFHGTKNQAKKKLKEYVHAVDHHEYVDASKKTVGEWLTEWLANVIKPSKRPNTYATYKSIITGSLIPAIGTIRLQELSAIDLEKYAADHGKLSASTVRLHQVVMSAALKSALRKKKLVTRNVAQDVEGHRKIERSADDIAANVLDIDQARRLLAAAKTVGTKQAAFYALALDSGARLNELGGLQWTDVNFEAGKITIVRQLASSVLGETGEVRYGPTKTGRSRTVDLGPETVTLLRAHKVHQAEVKMKNRSVYQEFGLVFTKEPEDLFRRDAHLGTPIKTHNIGTQEFARLIKTAKVKRITFHGLRHTSATLLLMAGVPAKVVSERLGHVKISTTMDIYSHVLPSMGRGAADQMNAMLYG